MSVEIEWCESCGTKRATEYFDVYTSTNPTSKHHSIGFHHLCKECLDGIMGVKED